MWSARIEWIIIRSTVIEMVIECVRRPRKGEMFAVGPIQTVRSIHVESIANCVFHGGSYTGDTLLSKTSPFLFEYTQFDSITVS